MSKKDELAVKEEAGALALGGMFMDDAGAGFENADQDSFSIPYLTVLQKMSPQCDDSDGEYLESAKPGMFFNSVSKEMSQEVLLVPVYFQRKFVEWKPRTSGGGFVASHDPSDPVVGTAVRGDDGKFNLPNGNYLSDTRYHFCLVVNPETGSITPVVVSLSSTQIKKSKDWMTVMQNVRLRRPDGSSYNPPMYSHIYRCSSVNESNDKGSWKGWNIRLDRVLGSDPETIAFDKDVYEQAKSLLKGLKSGELHAAEPMDQTVGRPDPNENQTDAPF